MSLSHKTEVTIVGGGFTGLSAAYELVKKGISVTILEAEDEIGGLASAFEVGGEKLDRFYHHWFTSDLNVMGLIEELGLNERVEINSTNTGIYYANNFFKLATPWDLLNFTPLTFVDRIRLGLLALRARGVKDWTELESKTADQWLRELGGENVYRVVWQPLLKGKFGPYADEISAVWFWNKLKLRGSSRGKGGEERLAYFKGGFVALAEKLTDRIKELGGRLELNAPVSAIEPFDGGWRAITGNGVITSDRIIATTALPLIAEMVRGWAAEDYLKKLERIQYIGNICLILELDRSLSDTYWLNVNDPSFPFVGVIEHTNFAKPETLWGAAYRLPIEIPSPHRSLIHCKRRRVSRIRISIPENHVSGNRSELDRETSLMACSLVSARGRKTLQQADSTGGRSKRWISHLLHGPNLS